MATSCSSVVLVDERRFKSGDTRNPKRPSDAAEQRDAADEGRLEASRGIVVGTVIMNRGEVVRPSQLIASVRRLLIECAELTACR